MAAIVVGQNLTVVQDTLSAKFSKVFSEWLMRMDNMARDNDKTPQQRFAVRGDTRVFTMAGAPSGSTADDSPGQDMCFIIDTTNNDLYLVHTWLTSTNFTAVKVLEATGS